MNWYQFLGNIFILYYSLAIPFLSLVSFNLQTLIWKRCFLNKKKTQHSLCSKCTDGFITEFWELAVTQHHFVDWLEIFLSGLLNVLLKVIISHSCAIRKTLSCTWAMIYPLSWMSRFFWERHYSRAKSSNPSFGKSPELYLAFKLWS